MQSDSIRICPTCGNPITSNDPRQKFCSKVCSIGGEFREDYLHRAMQNVNKYECVEWPHSRNASGYGTMGYEGSSHLVHRLSYIWFVGPLVGEECALHSCDNPPCFNYLHLFKGDRIANNEDKLRKGRTTKGMDVHCCKLTPEQVVDIRSRWKPYSNAGDLAAQYGISTVQVRLIALGISQSHVGSVVTEHKIKPRLTAVQVEEIKRRWMPHRNTAELANEYGITTARVGQIGRGK